MSVCYRHPHVKSSQTCASCGNAICSYCIRTYRKQIHCSGCAVEARESEGRRQRLTVALVVLLVLVGGGVVAALWSAKSRRAARRLQARALSKKPLVRRTLSLAPKTRKSATTAAQLRPKRECNLTQISEDFGSLQAKIVYRHCKFLQADRCNLLSTEEMSRIYASHRKYRQAYQLVRGYVKGCPAHSTLTFHWWRLAMKLGKHDEAITASTRLVKANPEVRRGYVCRGQAYHRMGDYRKAQADFQKALRIAPQNIQLMRWLGDSHAKLGEYCKSARVLDAAYAKALKQGARSYRLLRDLIGRIRTYRQRGHCGVVTQREGEVRIGFTMMGSHPVIHMRINGDTRGRFLLDTGATYCTITPKLARRIWGSQVPRTDFFLTANTANGKTRMAVVQLESVELDQLRLKRLYVALLKKSLGWRIDGLLGQNFLKRFRSYFIDNEKQELVLKLYHQD